MGLKDAGEWSFSFSWVSGVKGNQSFLFCERFPFQPARLRAEPRPSFRRPSSWPPCGIWRGATAQALPAGGRVLLEASSGGPPKRFLLNLSRNGIKRLPSELAFTSRWAYKLSFWKDAFTENNSMLYLLAVSDSWNMRNICVVSKRRMPTSPSGNWTPVSRVTGGDTNHYTNEELLPTLLTSFPLRFLSLLPATSKCGNPNTFAAHICSGRLGLLVKRINDLE